MSRQWILHVLVSLFCITGRSERPSSHYARVLATEGTDGIRYAVDEAEAERCPQEKSLKVVLRSLGIPESRLQGDLHDFPGVTWHGCDVVAIRFGGPDLRGSLHPEIAELPKLRLLDLDDTNVSGSLDALAKNTELANLHLRHTRVGGRIEDLSKAKDLQILDLTGTEVTGDLAALANFTELLQLRLSNTAVSGELKSLAKLERLTELVLSNTAVFGDAAVMAEWSKIEHIDLSGIQVEFDLFQQFEPFKPMLVSMEWQCQWPELRFLDVSKTPQFSLAQNLLRPFAGCGKLVTLKAAGCGLAGPLWPEIAPFTEPLDVDQFPLTQVLSVLDLGSNNVTKVAKLPGNCRTLVLTGNPHVSFGPGVLEKAIKDIVFIDLRNATFGNRVKRQSFWMLEW